MTLDYKNIKINYKIKGKGPAVVLLHGFLESLEMWNTINTVLSENNQVMAIDLLGHGKTESLGYIHTMEAMADAVIAVLNHLNIKDASFIGHSMGGYVALALAEKEPHRVNGLCLMNSTFEADDDSRKIIRARAIKMAHTNYASLVRMSFANLFAPDSVLKYKPQFDIALKIALNTKLQGYVAAQEGMAIRQNRYKILKDLTGKSLIISGKKDTLIDVKDIEKQIKNTSIFHKEVSEGHMSHIENTKELTYILKHFIEK